MDSCFPPLAALSLGAKGPPKGLKGPKGLPLAKAAPKGLPALVPDSPSGQVTSATTDDVDKMGKINILQDLDLYYIRQIAHNLKVSRRVRFSGEAVRAGPSPSPLPAPLAQTLRRVRRTAVPRA